MADNTAEETKTEEQASTVEKKSGSKLIVILAIAILLLLIGGGVLAFLLLGSGNGSQTADVDSEYAVPGAGASDLDQLVKDTEKQDDGQPPIYVNLEKFTGNLRAESSEGSGTSGVAVANFSLVVASPKVQAAVEARIPQIRHQILRLLTSRTYNDLEQADGKEQLCEDVLIEVNRVLNPQIGAAFEMQLRADGGSRALTGHDVATDTSGVHEGFNGTQSRLSSARVQRLAESLPIRQVVYTNFILQKL